MTKRIVSDANVIIDMEHGKLLEQFFALPLEIITPDLLFSDELETGIPGLIDLGLVVAEMTPETIQYIDELEAPSTPLPGRYDLMALGLARQLGCMLITGDLDLRKFAEDKGFEVHGTIWILEKMLERELITVATAKEAFERMIENESRLPVDDFNSMLERFC